MENFQINILKFFLKFFFDFFFFENVVSGNLQSRSASA
jgi:hypothetical protein